jgi:hypothetical protein
MKTLLGAFVELRKVDFFVMSVYPPVRPHGKTGEKIPVSLKYDKNSGHFT